MNVIGSVEDILAKIEPDLGAKHIGPDRANESNDAAGFVLELPEGTRVRFSVSGRDCLQRSEGRMLEDLIRTKLKVAMKSATSLP